METATIELITPEIAKEYLKFNKANRPLSKTTVLYFAEQMKKGLWKLNGEAICFAEGGMLVNGQHRLNAIVQSDCPIKTFVVRGVSTDSFATYDTGRGRTASDIFAISDVPNSTAISAIVSRCMLLNRTNNLATACNGTNMKYVGKYSKGEILDEYLSSSELYDRALKVAEKCNRAVKLLKISEVAAMYAYLIKYRFHPQDKVEGFFFELFGINQETSNAPALLRAKLLKDITGVRDAKLTNKYKAEIIAKAWNCYIGNKDIKRLDYNEEREGKIYFL